MEKVKIKEELKLALQRIGGRAHLKDLGAEYKKNINYKKFGVSSFIQLLKNFQDIFDINGNMISLKHNVKEDKEFGDLCLDQQGAESFNLDEANDLLIPELTASTSNSSTKEALKTAVKIPKEQQRYTGAHLLTNSDTSEEDDNIFQLTSQKKSDDALSVVNALTLSSLENIFSTDDDANYQEELLTEVLDEQEAKSDCSLNQFISNLPLDDDVFYSHLPPISRDEKATVPKQYIGDYFENQVLYLSEIFDPVHFWFQLEIGEERFENFETFHAEFNREYKNLKERELIMADENYKEGLIVAAFIPEYDHWYRAKIINSFNMERDYVMLFYIDYGTNVTCKKKNIKYLFKHYLKYPKYCFRGRIANIVPEKNERSFQASQLEAFINKVRNDSFIGTVVRFEPDEEVYQLQLTSRKDGLNIEKFILEQKLGERISPIYHDKKFALGPPCYLIPTFKALEKEYPSYAALYAMQQSDVDFNILVDTNFLNQYRRHEIEANDTLKRILQLPRFSLIKSYFYPRHYKTNEDFSG